MTTMKKKKKNQREKRKSLNRFFMFRQGSVGMVARLPTGPGSRVHGRWTDLHEEETTMPRWWVMSPD